MTVKTAALAGVPQEFALLVGQAAVLAHGSPKAREQRTFWSWVSKGLGLVEAFYRELEPDVHDEDFPPFVMRLALMHAQYVRELCGEALREMDVMARKGVKQPPERRKFERLISKVEDLIEDLEDRLDVASARDAIAKGKQPLPWSEAKAELEA